MEQNLKRISDLRIVEGIRKGDENAFQSLYLQRYTSLAEFAFRYVRDSDAAEEVVHDVFLNLWMNRLEWSPRHGIDAYLFGAVRNRALNLGRAHKTYASNKENVKDNYTTPPAPDLSLLKNERDHAIYNAISQLPDRSREAVTLRWIHNMSHAEVADVLDVSEEAARKLSARAARQLRELLKDFWG